MNVIVAGRQVTLVGHEEWSGIWRGEIGPFTIEVGEPDRCVPYWCAHIWVTAEGAESCAINVNGESAQDAVDIAVRAFRDDASAWAEETRREYESLADHAARVEERMNAAAAEAARIESLLGGVNA